jgi:hypothetical protein
MTTYAAQFEDDGGNTRLSGQIEFEDGTVLPTSAPYTIDSASSAAIITGLVALGLFIDNT